MSEPALPPSSSEDLQFTTVEAKDVNASAAGSSRKCAACGQPIVSTYYAVGDKIVCPTCREQIIAPVAGSRAWSFVKASLMGLGAGLVGAVIWFAIRRVAHLEIGLVAILVGFMVGAAVRKGSRGRGGVGYQVLAVVITYCCIAANYMPDIMEVAFEKAREQHKLSASGAGNSANAELNKNGDLAAQSAEKKSTAHRQVGVGEALVATVVVFGVVFALSLAAPFLAGAQNVIGLLIIGFALWEAWKLNARRQLRITGPYQLAPAPSA